MLSEVEIERSTQTHSEVRRVARLLHPASSKERLLGAAHLTAYMDESGTHGGPVVVVGGYLGMAREWEKLESLWRPVITREGLTAFHAADSTRKEGEFAGWDWARGDRVYRELISIIAQHNLWAVAIAVVTDDFRSIVSTPELKKNVGDEYHLAMQKCFTEFAHLIRDGPDALPADELIAYVFERNHQFAGRALEIFQGILKYHDGERFYRLGSIAYEDSVKFVPLQVADILVYETYREMDRKLNRKGAKSNGAFKALTANGANWLGFFDKEKLEELQSNPKAIDMRY